MFIKDATILDIGANIGELTLALLGMGAKKVICFEPDPSALKVLQKNLAPYDDQVEIQSVALSNYDGAGVFYCQSSSSDSSLIPTSKPTHSIKIDVARIDSLYDPEILRKIDVVKIDAEGGEPEILEGADQLLHHISYITIDTSPERLGVNTYEACAKILIKHNFCCHNYFNNNHLVGIKSL